MCGRYALTLPPEAVAGFFRVQRVEAFPPRYNIAPTQPVLVARAEGPGRALALMRWGFLPGWVKDPKDFPLLINARAETLGQKPAFRAAVRRRRCLFPADGFYEWRRDGRRRTPFLIRRPDRGLFAMAGLWETWSDPQGGEVDTACIVTVAANADVAALHERMPAIIAPEEFDLWLSGEHAPLEAALDLLRPAPEGAFEMVEISSRINAARFDSPELQAPAAAAPPRLPFDEG
jgi:putative SOS response-associated peptidase YedK